MARCHSRTWRLGAGALSLVLVSLSSSWSSAQEGGDDQDNTGAEAFDFQRERRGRQDVDARGEVPPTAGQLAAASDETVRWNRLGSPHVVTGSGEPLAEGLPGDPVDAARAWLAASDDLFGLGAGAVSELDVVRLSPVGAGHVVLLQQRFGDLPTGIDGLVGVGVADGAVASAWSSLARDTEVTGEAQLSAEEAVSSAAADVGRDVAPDDVDAAERDGAWSVMEIDAGDEPVRARLVAVPTPRDGVRPSWEVLLLDVGASEGYRHFIDAETGRVLVRTDVVDHAQDGEEPGAPGWEVFPVSPPLGHSSVDTRETWCWEPGEGCDEVIGNPASPEPWDVDVARGAPSETSRGNSARGTEKWYEVGDIVQGTVLATPSPTRDYDPAWTNQWFEESCDPNATFTTAQRNDIDAALTNMFVGHNRMHDWSYHLGFTEERSNLEEHNFGRDGFENDPEHGNAQAGGIIGGPPDYRARNNANQFWTPDGIAPTTNMFLFQPIPGAFYAPCVDGAYDMSVVGHEYGHAISNRSVGGPDDRLREHQANAMGESWSDLMILEHLHELELLPLADENPWAVSPYPTGDPDAGIRNYGLNESRLNHSNVGYDLTGPNVHADGEIWSAANFAVREAMVERHGAGDPELQRRCAAGEVDADACPGNYRWMQLVFDAWLLLPAATSMVMPVTP